MDVPPCGLRTSDFGLRTSVLGAVRRTTSDFGLRASDFGSKVWSWSCGLLGGGLRTSDCGLRLRIENLMELPKHRLRTSDPLRRTSDPKSAAPDPKSEVERPTNVLTPSPDRSWSLEDFTGLCWVKLLHCHVALGSHLDVVQKLTLAGCLLCILWHALHLQNFSRFRRPRWA